MVLSETLLIHDFNFVWNNYQTICSLRKFNKSDSVTILIKENIKLINVKNTVISNCNSLELLMEIKESIFIKLGIYRSPNDKIDLYLIELYLLRIVYKYNQ